LVVKKLHCVLSVLLIFAALGLHHPACAIDKVAAVIDEDIFACLIVIFEGVLVIC
jgi:hypothetical protein